MTAADAAVVEHSVYHEGARLHVLDYPGDEPAIVLMHGFLDDHRSYDKLVAVLPTRRVVTFDWLGYGRSDRSRRDGPSEDHGSELRAVLDGLGITRAVLVGHDASGPDAVAFALARPERVDHLVLLSTIFGHRPSLRLPEMIRLLADPGLGALAEAMVGDDAQRLWLVRHTAAEWDEDALDPGGVTVRSILPQFFGDADQPDAIAAIRAWTARLFEALEAQDALIESGALRSLEVAASVVSGEKDRYLSPMLGAEIAGLFEDASLHVVPGAAHWPQFDRADLVAELLERCAAGTR
ncbi:MAG TPA: alpha/beta hydrolase [Acidimicrobiales bacterium]|nr:alpha/beta hydrolase [Acidimicrobiales bacterium]